MTNWKDLEKSGRGLIEIPSWHFPGVTKEDKMNLRIVGVLAEIRPEHLQNTSLEGCYYPSPVGSLG
jgi:hypothetical protein